MKIAIITGGWSGEREISLNSAKSMLEAIKHLNKYDVCVIDFQKNLQQFVNDLKIAKPDVALLAIHGVGAEDGVLQGILEIAGIPYTSSSVTASAISMDKIFTRIITEKIGIQGPKWKALPIDELRKNGENFAFPYVIKPRNEGSSIGVSIIYNQKDLEKALDAWTFGNKVLLEEYIKGKEIQVAIICGKAIGTLEVQPDAEFFNYHAKYTDGITKHIFPAQIPDDINNLILKQSEQIFSILECSGIARTEFIYGEDSKVYFLEINTQPGMTSLSIVPDIAKNFDISYIEIIEKMIEAAILIN
ncbi:MAG: D-alanine--D-alanine ligase [Holosporales bacterium]|jgi:D-alanine-D-alanine ligase|nr:D-alanine--D-alanine ligase [Holosporales bacterium]